MSPLQATCELQPLVETTPACLRARAQWVCWKYVQRGDKWTKSPVNPHTGEIDDANSAATWGTFDEAIATLRRSRDLAGIGFVFTADDPYCGIDLDDCIDPSTGEPKPWGQQIIDSLSSYCEISPSGTGVKIFIEGIKPGERCRHAYHDGEVEIYDRGRFFAVTGQKLPESASTVVARQAELETVYEQVFGPAHDDGGSGADQLDLAPPAALEDDQILDIASRSRSGAKFQELWSGTWQPSFKSHSEADSSLMFMLAFYSKDPGQLERLFRRSGLMRDKWDEKHGARTYGQITIDKALATITQQYQPRATRNTIARSDAPGGDAGLGGEPQPGTIDPATDRLILSSARTLPTAQAYIQRFHHHPEGRTLHHYAGMLMEWRGNRYVEVEDDAVRCRLLPWMHTGVRMVKDPRSGQWNAEDFPANPSTVKSALESIRASTHLPVTTVSPCWLGDAQGRPDPREILPCRSTLLHLPTSTHLAPTPAFFTFGALDYDPDPSAKVPEQWLTFLGQLLGEDYQAWDLLQEWFGYCLTGDTSLHKMLLLVGPKRSGKGTIARVLTHLVGVGNVAGPTTSSLAGSFGLQPLIGKSLGIVSDARFSGENIQTVVERLLCISGEDTLPIDRKHMTSVTLKLLTRFMFLTNELPRLSDASGALAGRFMMIRLNESFYGREDKSLTEKLLAELPGILNWAIAGWRRLRERGHFVQPSSVEETLADLEDLASPVGAFVRERCVIGAGHRIWVDRLYSAWKTWCEEDGRTSVTTKQTFGRDLLAAVAGITCRRNSIQGRFYEGLDLADRGVPC
jgi:putative DNA primase/helicase